MANGLELEEETLPIEISEELESRNGVGHIFLVLSISDTGIGIPKEKQPILFQRFQQIDGASDYQYNGSGLGLALSKQLAELHGGRVSFSSTLGVGSTFSVWLPLGKQDCLP